MRLYSGSPNPCCFFLSSLICGQLWKKASVMNRHTQVPQLYVFVLSFSNVLKCVVKDVQGVMSFSDLVSVASNRSTFTSSQTLSYRLDMTLSEKYFSSFFKVWLEVWCVTFFYVGWITLIIMTKPRILPKRVRGFVLTSPVTNIPTTQSHYLSLLSCLLHQ